MQNVAKQLGRRVFNHPAYGIQNCRYGLGKCFDHLLGADGDDLGKSLTDASSLHLYVYRFRVIKNGTDLLFDRLCGSFTNQYIIFAAHVTDDRLVELVTRDLGGARHNNAAKRKNGYVGGSTANVNNHVANGGIDVQPCANGGGNRLFDQVGLLRARFACGIQHCLFLYLGNARGNADHNVRLEKEISASATNKILDHFERDLVLADNTVTQRSDRNNVAGGAAQHLLCFDAHLEDAVGVGVDRHNRGLLEHNALALHVDQNGCGTEVYADVTAELELLNKGFCAL